MWSNFVSCDPAARVNHVIILRLSESYDEIFLCGVWSVQHFAFAPRPYRLVRCGHCSSKRYHLFRPRPCGTIGMRCTSNKPGYIENVNLDIRRIGFCLGVFLFLPCIELTRAATSNKSTLCVKIDLPSYAAVQFVLVSMPCVACLLTRPSD